MSTNINRLCAPIVALLAITLVVGTNPVYAGGEECVRDGADTTEICLAWSQVGDPVEDQDFRVDFTDAENPDVELITPDLAWTLTSEDLSTGEGGNIGALTLNPDVPSSGDFKVYIPNASTPGVANVGSLDLTKTNWTGYSSLASGSYIDGNLNGNLVLQEESGSGGVCALTLGGRINGNVNVPKV